MAFPFPFRLRTIPTGRPITANPSRRWTNSSLLKAPIFCLKGVTSCSGTAGLMPKAGGIRKGCSIISWPSRKTSGVSDLLFPDANTGKIPPALLNFLAWPDLPPPPSEEHPHLLIKEGVLEIRQVRPFGFEDSFLNQAADPKESKALLRAPLGRYARLRALTAMRQELVREADFRLCIGGAPGKPERRLPGVIEEALLTSRAGKPLYISGAFGGVSKALADCLLQRRNKMDVESVFFTPDPLVQLMTAYGQSHPFADEFEGPSTSDGWSALAYFKSLSLDALGTQAGLTTEQYIDLLATPNIERAMAWVMSGVSNMIQQA